MDQGSMMEWQVTRFWEAGVKRGAWNGGFPKTPRRGDSLVYAASGVVAPEASSGPVRAF